MAKRNGKSDDGGGIRGHQPTPEQLASVAEAAGSGGSLEPECLAKRDEIAATLRAGQSECDECNAQVHREIVTVETIRPAVERCIHELKGASSWHVTSLTALAADLYDVSRLRRAHEFTLGQHGLTKEPNPVTTLLIMALLWILESSGMMNVFYIAGAVPDVATAIGVSLVISGFNIACAAGVGGYLCGRNLFYGADAPIERPRAQPIRRAAAVGIVSTVCILIFLLFVVSLARAQGRFENIEYGLDELKLVATNFWALLALGLGALTSIAAWYKGVTGFRSRRADLRVYEQEEDRIKDDGYDLYDEAGKEIQASHSKGEEELARVTHRVEIGNKAIKRWGDLAAKQNQKVDSAASRYESGCAALRRTYLQIAPLANGESEVPVVPQEFWEQFRPGEPPAPIVKVDQAALKALSQQLNDAADEARRAVGDAWTDFCGARNQEGHDHA